MLKEATLKYIGTPVINLQIELLIKVSGERSNGSKLFTSSYIDF